MNLFLAPNEKYPSQRPVSFSFNSRGGSIENYATSLYGEVCSYLYCFDISIEFSQLVLQREQKIDLT